VLRSTQQINKNSSRAGGEGERREETRKDRGRRGEKRGEEVRRRGKREKEEGEIEREEGNRKKREREKRERKREEKREEERGKEKQTGKRKRKLPRTLNRRKGKGHATAPSPFFSPSSEMFALLFVCQATDHIRFRFRLRSFWSLSDCQKFKMIRIWKGKWETFISF
jgi:hypothetical protein